MGIKDEIKKELGELENELGGLVAKGQIRLAFNKTAFR